MIRPCQRCLATATHRVTMRAKGQEPLDLCGECSADAIRRGWVKSLVDIVAVWGPS